MNVTVNLSINIDVFYSDHYEHSSIPILPLTRLVERVYTARRLLRQVKEKVRQMSEKISVAMKLTQIGLSAAQFAVL